MRKWTRGYAHVPMWTCRKLKDQERQGQLIKERIEDRKRRRQQQETSLTDNSRSGTVVVHVSESNDSFNSHDN